MNEKLGEFFETYTSSSPQDQLLYPRELAGELAREVVDGEIPPTISVTLRILSLPVDEGIKRGTHLPTHFLAREEDFKRGQETLALMHLWVALVHTVFPDLESEVTAGEVLQKPVAEALQVATLTPSVPNMMRLICLDVLKEKAFSSDNSPEEGTLPPNFAALRVLPDAELLRVALNPDSGDTGIFADALEQYRSIVSELSLR